VITTQIANLKSSRLFIFVLEMPLAKIAEAYDQPGNNNT